MLESGKEMALSWEPVCGGRETRPAGPGARQ